MWAHTLPRPSLIASMRICSWRGTRSSMPQVWRSSGSEEGGSCVFLNTAAEELFGWNCEEMTRRLQTVLSSGG